MASSTAYNNWQYKAVASLPLMYHPLHSMSAAGFTLLSASAQHFIERCFLAFRHARLTCSIHTFITLKRNTILHFNISTHFLTDYFSSMNTKESF